ncbi:MAG: hypothetical protein JJU12_05655 [Chlamydiales bacterium]|nr:hypothetical protein [Chlamydiales bacterium]
MSNSVSFNRCPICWVEYDEEVPITSKETLSYSERVSEDDLSLVRTKCNHVFHNSCLQNWVQQFKFTISKPTCPVCRTVLIDAFSIEIPLEREERASLAPVIMVIFGAIYFDHLFSRA